MHTLSAPPNLIPRILFDSLKLFVCGLVAPFVLIAALAALSLVVLDFIWFRIHETMMGNPAPKGIWEF